MNKNQFMKEDQGFIKRLIAGYEKAKRSIAYIIMVIAIILGTLPHTLIPENIRSISQASTLVILALILLEVLFKIYEKVVQDKPELRMISSNDLLANIVRIVSKEKNIKIQYLAMAGRHGWQTVLEKLLNENSEHCIVGKANLNIEVALIDPKFCKSNPKHFEKFEVVESVSKEINRKANELKEVSNGKLKTKIKLHHYGHMPNMLGFLVNDNYLFITNAYWEEQRGKLVFRGGGSDYFVFNKGDVFGGDVAIHRFKGWMEYICNSYNGESEIKETS